MSISILLPEGVDTDTKVLKPAEHIHSASGSEIPDTFIRSGGLIKPKSGAPLRTQDNIKVLLPSEEQVLKVSADANKPKRTETFENIEPFHIKFNAASQLRKLVNNSGDSGSDQNNFINDIERTLLAKKLSSINRIKDDEWQKKEEEFATSHITGVEEGYQRRFDECNELISKAQITQEDAFRWLSRRQKTVAYFDAKEGVKKNAQSLCLELQKKRV